MTVKIILISVIIILVLVVYAVITTKKLNKISKELNVQNKGIEIDKETKEKIKSITTGDIDADFNAGIDLLHKLSKK